MEGRQLNCDCFLTAMNLMISLFNCGSKLDELRTVQVAMHQPYRTALRPPVLAQYSKLHNHASQIYILSVQNQIFSIMPHHHGPVCRRTSKPCDV